MANIIICADGTWNKPEENLKDDEDRDYPTNVLKLARAIAPELDNTKQHVFYDWGIGSYHSSWLAGMTGKGIQKNITDGYRYILQNYSPGDKIFLLGFSRGAYTVRALCGLINNAGILKRKHAEQISEAWNLYKNRDASCKPKGEKSVSFRNTYSHESKLVHFIGVWDTVGALGVPFSFLGFLDGDYEFYDTKMGSNVSIARHALAIDEKREDFEPTIWSPREGVDLKQVWFAGVHSDVGGSYPPGLDSQTTASDIPLKWLLDEAAKAGLHMENHVYEKIMEDPLSPIHESYESIYRFKRPHYRPLEVQGKPTKIHSSVIFRRRNDASYRPPNLEDQL